MTRRDTILLAAAGLALHALLAAGAAAGLPDASRVVLAFAALVLMPGLAFVAAGLVPPGGSAFAAGWALGFGVAWTGAWALGADALGAPVGALATWMIVPTAGLWLLVIWRPPGTRIAEQRPSAAVLAAVVLAAALAAWCGARLGPPITVYSDSPDHIATVRRILAGGEAFPHDAYHRDAGALGADPRKGLWHAQVALITRLAGADPVVAWRWLDVALAPLFVINAAILGWVLRGPTAAGVAAWALALAYGGSIAETALRQSVYSTRVADQLVLATMAAALADLARPSQPLRSATIVLALGAVSSHVFAAFHLTFALGALGVAMVLRDRGASPRLRRLAATAGWAGVACAPYVAWRLATTLGPASVIHAERQGLMEIGGGLAIVPFGMLWEWLGIGWVLFPLASPRLWRKGGHDAGALWLVAVFVAVAAVIFNPLAVAWLEPRFGYLLARFVWMLPLSGLVAWLAIDLVEDLRRPGGRRLAPALGLLGLAILHLPAAGDAWLVLTRPDRLTAGERLLSPDRWADALRRMDRELPAGTVVLSDPATSYTVPMATRHYVVAMPDQHGSPRDTLALRRLIDARDALDPYGTWERTREVIRRYGVGAVALNDRFGQRPALSYWGPDPAWFAAARARLDGAPGAFEKVLDTGDFVVYRVRPSGLDTLSGPPRPRPFVRPFVSGRSAIARRMGEDLPVLHIARLGPAIAAPGETLIGIADWRALAPLRPRSYSVAVRFDRDLPWGLHPPAWLGKPVRKAIEALKRERYRFRSDHAPTGNAYGVDRWRPDEIVRDSFTVAIPPYVAAGDYAIRVRMIAQPVYPNYRLSDYFFDQDYYSGLTVGRVRIATDAPALRREHNRRLEAAEQERRRAAETGRHHPAVRGGP